MISEYQDRPDNSNNELYIYMDKIDSNCNNDDGAGHDPSVKEHTLLNISKDREEENKS